MCIDDNDTITVSSKDCDSTASSETQEFIVKGHIVNTTECGVIMKIDVLVTPCDLQASSICLTTDCATNPTDSTTAMGAIVGLLVILVALLTISLVWTCCILKKRGQDLKKLEAR